MADNLASCFHCGVLLPVKHRQETWRTGVERITRMQMRLFCSEECFLKEAEKKEKDKKRGRANAD